MDREASGDTPSSGPRPARRRYGWRSLGLEPALRLGGWALRALLGGLGAGLLAPFSSAATRQTRARTWRLRCFEGLVDVLGRLKGPFVKAGQFAAHRHDLLPAEAAAPLASLRDRVVPLPEAEIRAVVEAELAAPIEVLFSEFDPAPLGAASVAQVHRARLPNGEEVAVKVQYPWLEAALPADLAWVRGLLALAARLGPWGSLHGGGGARRTRIVDRARVVAEFEAGLREELDFENEAASAVQIAANLAGDPQIVVPRVVASHSSRRVLTTSYQPAVRITDREALSRLGVQPKEVLAIVARAYAKQVFVDGFFHADPHPGNLFVLDDSDGDEPDGEGPRVLFVDFGLSRRLDPELRREMRLGVYALLQRDVEAFVAAMCRTGMIAPGAEPGVRGAVKRMLERLRGEGSPLGLAGSSVLGLKDEAVALLRQTDGLQLPDDLLLFARTLSYVFALGRELDPDVDLMPLCLPYLMKFLGDPGGGPGGG